MPALFGELQNPLNAVAADNDAPALVQVGDNGLIAVVALPMRDRRDRDIEGVRSHASLPPIWANSQTRRAMHGWSRKRAAMMDVAISVAVLGWLR
jgi:hypothetical protein